MEEEAKEVKKPDLFCSFCGKHQHYVKRLIAQDRPWADAVFICDECVSLCAKIINEDKSVPAPEKREASHD